MNNIIYVTTESFEQEVLKSDKPVLVDFFAEWCGPCKMMNPVLEELEKDYQGKVKFAKVDVDKYQDLAMEYKIMSIPAMILFKDGVAKEKVVGFHPKKDMANYLDEKLAEVE